MNEQTARPSLGTEIVAGMTTFFTMSYIVIVNPTILSTEGTGMPFSGVLTATVLVAALMTLLMGLYARLPFGVAPGMGLNAFFTYTIVLQGGVPWPVALGIVFWAGVLFLLVSATPLRESIAMAIPSSLRMATAAGIGLLLTFIGLRTPGSSRPTRRRWSASARSTIARVLTLAALAIIVWLTRRRQPRRVPRQHFRGDRDRLGGRLGRGRPHAGSARRISLRSSSSSTCSARSSSRSCRPSSR